MGTTHTKHPTAMPTAKPTYAPGSPTPVPSFRPTSTQTKPDSKEPTQAPTKPDSSEPTQVPTKQSLPTQEPTKQSEPTQEPTKQSEPTQEPTKQSSPTAEPSKQGTPTLNPTAMPSSEKKSVKKNKKDGVTLNPTPSARVKDIDVAQTDSTSPKKNSKRHLHAAKADPVPKNSKRHLHASKADPVPAFKFNVPRRLEAIEAGASTNWAASSSNQMSFAVAALAAAFIVIAVYLRRKVGSKAQVGVEDK